MLDVALEQAHFSLNAGGIPCGSALFDNNGVLLGAGCNKKVQNLDPLGEAELEALRAAGIGINYELSTLICTICPSILTSQVIVTLGINRVVIGTCDLWVGGLDILKLNKIDIIDLKNRECFNLLNEFIEDCPDIWSKSISVGN